jgi:hypothetical protein
MEEREGGAREKRGEKRKRRKEREKREERGGAGSQLRQSGIRTRPPEVLADEQHITRTHCQLLFAILFAG